MKSQISTLYLFIFFLLFISLITSCGGETKEMKSAVKNDFSDCKYGTPSAVFKESIKQIVSHSFKIEGKEGIEKVTFSDGQVLELNQSGCNEVLQTFKFDVKGDHSGRKSEEWIALAVDRLRYLGSLSPDYASLSFWGNEIEDAAIKIKLGDAYEIQPGFKVKIDKVLSTNESLLFITLSQ